jgi:hypothetical protein
MTTPQITIHNAITGEIVTRDMNETELAQAKADEVANKLAADQAAADATVRATARQALLDKLQITADEAQLLLG